MQEEHKKPSWKLPEHMLTSPNVFGRMSRQNWSFLVHPHLLIVYRRKNEALKEKKPPLPTVKHGGGMFFVLGPALLHLAQRTLDLCRAQVSRLPKHPGVKHIAECQKAQPESEVTGSKTQKYKNG